MFKIICVTDRKSCKEDLLTRIEKIAAAKPDRIMFRDKECGDEEYVKFALRVLEIGDKYGVQCSMYRHIGGFGAIHMTMATLRNSSQKDMQFFEMIGSSVHSVEEAIEAEQWGVDYVIAGHIFATDCKKGLPPRGLDFLKQVCESVKIPVYAIGGINADNIKSIAEAGADGACIMSGFMTCDDPSAYIKELRKGAEISEF